MQTNQEAAIWLQRLLLSSWQIRCPGPQTQHVCCILPDGYGQALDRLSWSFGQQSVMLSTCQTNCLERGLGFKVGTGNAVAEEILQNDQPVKACRLQMS